VVKYWALRWTKLLRLGRVGKCAELLFFKKALGAQPDQGRGKKNNGFSSHFDLSKKVKLRKDNHCERGGEVLREIWAERATTGRCQQSNLLRQGKTRFNLQRSRKRCSKRRFSRNRSVSKQLFTVKDGREGRTRSDRHANLPEEDWKKKNRESDSGRVHRLPLVWQECLEKTRTNKTRWEEGGKNQLIGSHRVRGGRDD